MFVFSRSDHSAHCMRCTAALYIDNVLTLLVSFLETPSVASIWNFEPHRPLSDAAALIWIEYIQIAWAWKASWVLGTRSRTSCLAMLSPVASHAALHFQFLPEKQSSDQRLINITSLIKPFYNAKIILQVKDNSFVLKIKLCNETRLHSFYMNLDEKSG